MIKCYLFGGIGNQMFQYLSGIYLSKQNNMKVKFDYKFISSFNSQHNNKSLNEIFNLEDKFFSKETNSIVLNFSKILKFFFNLLCIFKFNVNFISDYNYTNKLNEKKNYLMFGYFQNIQKIDKEIIDVENFFKFKEIYFKNNLYKKVIAYENSVCLHIRRGDYLTPKYKKKYVILNEDYYMKAINFILKKKNNLHFFIFSDDKDYAKNFCNKIEDYNKFSYTLMNKNSSDLDLFLMSHCKNFIIANSTFSWWAAIISKNKKKITITPRKWFKNKNDNENNKLILDQWVKI
ncbi:alpha-1,2-fucosyltransferase [Candidatus Pelagibacter ubique]|nr:alpha-1,2-fucosyltransferase [Candidatus Pelagibacter ubique]